MANREISYNRGKGYNKGKGFNKPQPETLKQAKAERAKADVFHVDGTELVIPIVILKVLEDEKNRTVARITNTLIERWKGNSKIAPHLSPDNVNRLCSAILQEIEAMQEAGLVKRAGVFYSITSKGKNMAEKIVLA